jgi:hypothetical protein
MNVTSAYGQQNIWDIQEIQRPQRAWQRQPMQYTSMADSISISPKALELAKAAQKNAVTSGEQKGEALDEEASMPIISKIRMEQTRAFNGWVTAVEDEISRRGLPVNSETFTLVAKECRGHRFQRIFR